MKAEDREILGRVCRSCRQYGKDDPCTRRGCIVLRTIEEKEQMIEKACEWLEPIFKDLAGYNCGGDLINAFKKAMKE